MPKQANPLTAISKKLKALKAKSEKLAQEIADLSALVAAEASKALSTTPAPVTKKPVAKKSATSEESKKSSKVSSQDQKRRGRPRKLPFNKKELSEMKNAMDNFVG
jgi:hypothetical protein